MKPRHAHLNRDATPLGINLHFPQSAKWMSSVGNRTVSEIACMPRCPALPRPAGPGAKSEPPLVSQPGLFWYSIPNSARYLPHFLGHLIQLVTESSFCRAWRTTCQNLPMNKEKKNTNRVIVSLQWPTTKNLLARNSFMYFGKVFAECISFAQSLCACAVMHSYLDAVLKRFVNQRLVAG